MRWALAVLFAVASSSGGSALAAKPDIAALVDQIGGGGPSEWAALDAERELEHIGKPALGALLTLLRSQSPEHQQQRQACVRLLAKIDPPTALAVLPAYLGDSSPWVRQEVIRALGSLGTRASSLADRVRPFVDDSDAVTRVFARIALIQMTGERTPHLRALADIALDPNADVEKDAAISQLWSLGDRAREVYPLFIARFHARDAEARRAAVGAFNWKGPEAPEIVAGLLDVMEHDPSPRIRESAVGALATIGPAARPAVPALVRTLDRDPDNGWIYALALIHIGDESTLPVLFRALDSRHVQTRLTTASDLTQFRSDAAEVARVLRRHMKDPSPEVRTAIADSLRILDQP